MVSGDGLTWRDEFPRVGPDCWLVVISKWYVSSSRAVDSVSSVCSALSPRRCFAWLHITLFAHVFFFVNGLWFWADVCEPGTGREKAKLLLNVDIWGIQGFHLIATVAMAPSVSLTVIIIMVTGGGRESWMSWQRLTSTWRPPALSLPLSLSLPPSAVCFLSPSGYTLISHGVWREQWSRRERGGGGGWLYRLLLCQVYNAKCMFPGLSTHSCGLCAFTLNIPLGMIRTSLQESLTRTFVCVYICVRGVCVCVWGKVMSKGWKVVVLGYQLLPSLSSSNNNFTPFATRRWLNRKRALKGQFDSKSRASFRRCFGSILIVRLWLLELCPPYQLTLSL